jgi:hypothetical protein
MRIIHNLQEVAKTHGVSMAVRAASLRTLQEISDASSKVVTVHATPGQKNRRLFQICIDIRKAMSGVASFPKGCFRAELYPLVATKLQEPDSAAEVDQTIGKFCAALNSFEAVHTTRV